MKCHPVGAAGPFAPFAAALVDVAGPSLPCIHSSSGGLHMVKSVQVQLSKKRPVLPGRGVASECAAGHRPRWGQGV